jgi:hypothetical protein
MVMIRRLMAAAMVSAFASGTTMAASTPALKPIDPAALQAAIEGLSKELMLPGAMVLLSTPRAMLSSVMERPSLAPRTRHAPTPTSARPRIPKR